MTIKESALKRPPNQDPIRLVGGSGSAPPPAMETVSAAELAAMSLAEPRWAVRGLIPSGVTLLAGAPKVGKSWLLLGLACAVASGGLALGCFPAEHGGVLYLALEDTRRRLQTRMNMLRTHPPALHFATRHPKIEDGGLDVLGAWLAQHKDVRLVLIDTLQRMRRVRRSNVDAYGLDCASLEGFVVLANEFNTAFILSHHDRKAPALDPLDVVSGTHGITGSVDTVAVLTRARGQADGKLLLAGRDVEEAELALRFDNGRWTLLGQASEYEVSRERRRVLDLLARRPMTPKSIAEALEVKRDAVRHLLRRMEADGLVASTDGLYIRLPRPATSLTPFSSHTADTDITGIASITGVTAHQPGSCDAVLGATSQARRQSHTVSELPCDVGDVMWTGKGDDDEI